MESLSLDTLGTSSAEFHEDAGAACLATDSVAFAMEGFDISAYCAFVIYKFNHLLRPNLRELPPFLEHVPREINGLNR